MKIEDIDLEGKTPEQIVKIAGVMYKQANKFLQRAEEELGLEVAYFNAAMIRNDKTEGIHTVQNLYDENILIPHCMTDENGELTRLGEIGEIYGRVQLINAIGGMFFDDEDEEEEK